MSIDPRTIWSERFEEIGSLIEQQTDVLTERWSERAEKEQENAPRAHYQEMRNHLPELLRAIGQALAKGSSAVPAPHAMLALAHGEQRWKIGWQLAEVIRDYQILRLVIVEHLDAVLESPLQTREAMAVGLALDEAISASVMAYVGHQEGQLREATSRLTDFLPVVGHELRNPLSAAVGALEIVKLQQTDDPVLVEAFGIIERQLHQITRLAGDMLDASRIIRGQLELRSEVVELRQIVDRAVETVRPLCSTREHAVEVSLPEGPLCVRGDPARLQQILVNLLNNAARYTPPKGRITVLVEPAGSQAVVRVRDNGVGIAPEMLPKIFEMFAQGHHRAEQGLGIGLALVKALVALHGGTIEAFSSGPGQGSEFVVKLPMVKDTVPAQQPKGRERSAGKAAPCYRILLVDDHLDSAQTLAVLLERLGHEVHLVHDGLAGLSKARERNPDVILIDIGLPEMDGYELAQRLREDERFRATPLVAVTGYANEESQKRAKLAGFHHVLAKPIELAVLQRVLATFKSR